MTAEEAIEELRLLIAYALPQKAAGAEIKPMELALLQAYEKSEQILSLLKTDRMALAKRLIDCRVKTATWTGYDKHYVAEKIDYIIAELESKSEMR